MNHRLARIEIELVINGNSSKVFQPGERALHNTSEWQHGEFLRRLVRTENNGKLRTELLAYGIGQFPSFVSAVRQHLFQSEEAALHLVNNAIRTDTVMDIRLVNHHAHRKPKYVKHNMFLTPFNPLVAVDPTTGVNMMGGLDASGINDAETGGSSRPSACGPSDGAYPSVPQTRLQVSTC